ncbi:MAG: hypothetical protein ACI965_000682 [Paraglaciecola sp.]|jgi:hypothetical protein
MRFSSANFFNSMLSRIIAAIVGGFLLANLLSVLLSYVMYSFLSVPKADGVTSGILSSFLFYAVAIIWVFSVKTTGQAWLGLFITSLFTAIGVYLLMPEHLL